MCSDRTFCTKVGCINSTAVGYLGRWKSDVTLEYAQEALESMAVSATHPFIGPEKLSDLLKPSVLKNLLPAENQHAHKADKDVVDRLKSELTKFKQHTKGKNDS